MGLSMFARMMRSEAASALSMSEHAVVVERQRISINIGGIFLRLALVVVHAVLADHELSVELRSTHYPASPHVDYNRHAVGYESVGMALVVGNLEYLVGLSLVGACEAAVLTDRDVFFSAVERKCDRPDCQLARSGSTVPLMVRSRSVPSISFGLTKFSLMSFA